jgi:hypothetical protein
LSKNDIHYLIAFRNIFIFISKMQMILHILIFSLLYIKCQQEYDVTVINAVATPVPHALVTEYETMVAPEATPVTKEVSPPAGIMVAIAVSTLLHTPPAAVSVSMAEVPGHKVVVPEMAPNTGVVTILTVVNAVSVPQTSVTI